ncbi:MAG: hypothetical protein ACTSVM_04715, partial [Candidatus Ranarchaeia archaeon]
MKRKILLGVLLLFLFIIAPPSRSANTVSAQLTDVKTNSPSPDYQRIFQGITGPQTFVEWSRQTYSENWSDTWSHNQWLFGPYPRIESIKRLNGSEITSESYLETGETFIVTIIIPKAIFTSGSTLGFGGFRAEYRSQNGSVYAEINAGYALNISYMGMGFESDWYAESQLSKTNETWDDYYGGMPGSGGGSYQFSGFNIIGPIYEFNESLSSFTNDTIRDQYVIEIAGKLNDTAPFGAYRFSVAALDSDFNFIDAGYSNRAIDWDDLVKQIGVGEPVSSIVSIWGTWDFQKYDMLNRTILSVNRDEDFQMIFDITSNNLANVTLVIDMPFNVKVTQELYGWHTELQTVQGGWVYNSTLGTYVWDPDTNFTLHEEVFGPYTMEYLESIPWENRSVEVEVVNDYWDESGTMHLVKEKQTFPVCLYLIYDDTMQSFSSKWGITYSTIIDNQTLERSDNFHEISVDMSKSCYNFFKLNNSASFVEQLGLGHIKVGFVGQFTNYTEPGETSYMR